MTRAEQDFERNDTADDVHSLDLAQFDCHEI
jgi:hypothetical protein